MRQRFEHYIVVVTMIALVTDIIGSKLHPIMGSTRRALLSVFCRLCLVVFCRLSFLLYSKDWMAAIDSVTPLTIVLHKEYLSVNSIYLYREFLFGPQLGVFQRGDC